LGFVHLDIKPENIYVYIDPCSRVPIFKIGDFGTARSVTDIDDVEDGDNLYMANEILNSHQNPHPYRQFDKADIFSLGVVIYEALRGVPITKECIQSLRSGSVPRCDRISDELFALLEQMMHQNPSMRPSARDISNMPLIQSLFISSPELLPSLEISRSSSAPRPDHSPIISELRQSLYRSQCEALEARTLLAAANQQLEERDRAAQSERAAAFETQRALMQLLAR
jgi:serine/threonine protein kinase